MSVIKMPTYQPFLKHWAVLLLCLSLLTAGRATGQDLVADLAAVDGVELRPGNVLGFRVHNRGGSSVPAEISGRLQYRRSNLGFNFRFQTTLRPGVNTFEQQVNSATWTFSDPALKELFFTYGKLPQGTYEYCVQVVPKQPGAEQSPLNDPSACVYYTVEDMFLINLVDPEDDAKLYEYHPMLSWAVTYPFASELTYRLRVAERKSGQNKQNAITRNNPMYQDNRVMSTASVYPATARPLQLNQPYVWAVDAYFKGILLGGSEVWQFTIIEDSSLKAVPTESFYVDIRKETNTSLYYAVGELKVKYILDEQMNSTLKLRLLNAAGKEITLPQAEQHIVLGDNRFELDLKPLLLKHNKNYTLEVRANEGAQYTLPFRYINPDLAR